MRSKTSTHRWANSSVANGIEPGVQYVVGVASLAHFVEDVKARGRIVVVDHVGAKPKECDRKVAILARVLRVPALLSLELLKRTVVTFPGLAESDEIYVVAAIAVNPFDEVAGGHDEEVANGETGWNVSYLNTSSQVRWLTIVSANRNSSGCIAVPTGKTSASMAFANLPIAVLPGKRARRASSFSMAIPPLPEQRFLYVGSMVSEWEV